MVHFVGAGPGAPDLITVRGLALISQADCVIYAGSLVNPALLRHAREGTRILNSAEMTLDEVIGAILEEEAEGRTTVRLHTGDPALYGAVREQIDRLEEAGIAWDITPGVSAMAGAAAALGIELTLPGISQSVVITRMQGRTPVPPRESVRSFAAHGATMVLFLSAGMLGELTAELMAGGYSPDTPAALVYKATWPEEVCITTDLAHLAEAAEDRGIRRTALVIVGDVTAQSGYELSKLYDPSFSTEFRRAVSSGDEQGPDSSRKHPENDRGRTKAQGTAAPERMECGGTPG